MNKNVFYEMKNGGAVTVSVSEGETNRDSLLDAIKCAANTIEDEQTLAELLYHIESLPKQRKNHKA